MSYGSLGELITDAHALERDAFVARYRRAVLLIPQLGESSREVTRVFAPASSGSGSSLVAWDIVPVQKRSKTTLLPNLISVGRASSNDVVVASGEVSKVHAFFIVDKVSGLVRVTDAGSTNGTRLNGVALEPKEDDPELSGGDRLKFGGLEVVFHEPTTLWAYLRTLRLGAREA